LENEFLQQFSDLIEKYKNAVQINRKEIQQINQRADEIVNNFDNLVRYGRRHIKCKSNDLI